ncbi:acyl-CoA dehydrogenase [Amycolatopsis mediterranei S699]|uniref:Acyl-CoA dehydrogenase n=2 Tax=Amycolatopsis mediterranei TaxID=33910 RepID=A0A0H3DF49_AMYMU|nr:acyl-CoA dehydrogenase family protein [Amycolatopsis mediterranei]ADJ48837.1 acyl-CoA dehydrogenase [Amycolatopsis mediterranei U32]AEK45783.1 acyl-CoA dehydrogenase [Amycolatopsis mediterranei S699]AFO80547.1 acyl-CoA dehydrogenase [Amycolatopsis mediterranei S699]AGT87675.1 acyl-CoA dehydrogenase [Amycolatopsis mediterranei RB]KDU94048.1 acyl-CoA dehydrogenase [Amycolatopsis mediterranei]
MDFDLPEDAVAVQRLVRDFAAKEIEPYAADWSERAHFPAKVFRTLGELGLMGMLVDEAYGGANAGFVSYVAAMEALGAADQSVASAWNAHSTIASLPLATFGTEEQKQRWLVPLATGQNIGAFGLTEPTAGSDAASIRTRARRDGDGWVLNGTKMFISNAGTEMSLGVTVLAVTGDGDKRRFGTFFIPDGTPGYEKGQPLRKLGWHAMDTRELVFTDVRLPGDHLIGEEGNGLRQFLEVLDAGRISVAALGLSLAQASLDLALRHATDRQQFGRPLSGFQAVAHKLADMATEIEAARALVYRAAWLGDQGRPFSQEAAMAKLYASEVANRAASASVQIHGGYGYMRESAISRFYADAKILEIGEGTSEVQRNVIAKRLLKRH